MYEKLDSHGRKKYRYDLFPVTMSKEEAVKKLRKDVVLLTKHIYTAFNQEC